MSLRFQQKLIIPADSRPLIARDGLSSVLIEPAVKLLQDLQLLTELTGQKKNRLFSYAAYVELLAHGA